MLNNAAVAGTTHGGEEGKFLVFFSFCVCGNEWDINFALEQSD